jgi:hypothetical protein
VSSQHESDPAVARGNIHFLGRSDQGGRPDGTQVMLSNGHSIVGHMFSDGFSVIDVRDPRAPKPVAFVANPPNTRSHHIQAHDGILLTVNGANVWALAKYAEQKDYKAMRRSRRGCASTTSRSRKRRARSPSSRCRGSGCIASGGSADATPMRPRTCPALPITS